MKFITKEEELTSSMMKPPEWPIYYKSKDAGIKDSTLKEFNIDKKEISSMSIHRFNHIEQNKYIAGNFPMVGSIISYP